MLNLAAVRTARRRSTAVQQTRRGSRTHVTVHQTVDGEVEAGVQVRQHGGVQVNGQRQTVRAVVQQHDDVRAPAADERNEYDEHCFHLTNSQHRCNVAGISSLLQSKTKKTCRMFDWRGPTRRPVKGYRFETPNPLSTRWLFRLVFLSVTLCQSCHQDRIKYFRLMNV